jgi:hypothetical protein
VRSQFFNQNKERTGTLFDQSNLCGLTHLHGDVPAHSGKAFTQDAEEHVDQDEDHEEHVAEKVQRAQDAVCLVQHFKLSLTCTAFIYF